SGQALQGQLAVPGLAAGVLGDGGDGGAGTGQQALALTLVEHGRGGDVEHGFDPRSGDVGVLAAGAGGAAGAQLDLRQRDRQTLVDPQLVGHGYPASSGMWRSTCSASVWRTQRWVSA